jgi:hypothetical protein
MLPHPQEKSKIQPEQADQQVKMLVQQSGVPPTTLIQLGDMSKKALRDKALIPIIKNAAIKNNLAVAEDFNNRNPHQILAVFIALGDGAKKMMGQK